jgi:hypothetical protein
MKPLTRCNGRISMGRYTSNTTNLYVYFENLATRQVKRYETTTDGASLITLQHEDSLAPNTTYRIWLNEESLTQSEQVNWTLPDLTTSVSCVIQRFVDVFDADGNRVEQSTVTMEAA